MAERELFALSGVVKNVHLNGRALGFGHRWLGVIVALRAGLVVRL